MNTFTRQNQFKRDCNKAYRMIQDRGVITDSRLQYEIGVSNGTHYRIRKVLSENHDLFPDIKLENGYWRDLRMENKVEVSPNMPIDFWGQLEPNSKKGD